MPLPGQNGPYLRVLTPQTRDGMNLMYVDDRPVFKETHLPIQAKKGLEELNATLPDQLKNKIEIVQDEQPVIPIGKRKTIEEIVAERVAEEMAKLTQGMSEKMLQAKPFQDKPKGKPGPKKKIQEPEKV